MKTLSSLALLILLTACGQQESHSQLDSKAPQAKNFIATVKSNSDVTACVSKAGKLKGVKVLDQSKRIFLFSSTESQSRVVAKLECVHSVTLETTVINPLPSTRVGN